MIDDGSNSWGSTPNTNIERVNKLQKKAARVILKTDYTTPSEDTFQRLGWMPVAKRITLQSLHYTTRYNAVLVIIRPGLGSQMLIFL